ncbi:MAG: hypothetical protein AAFR55_06570 [Pseudomonadota bacterium]
MSATSTNSAQSPASASAPGPCGRDAVTTRLLVFFGTLVGGPLIGTFLMTLGLLVSVVFDPGATWPARLEALVAWPMVFVGLSFFALITVAPGALLSALIVTAVVWRWGTISYVAAGAIAFVSIVAGMGVIDPKMLIPTAERFSDMPWVLGALAAASAVILRWFLRSRLQPPVSDQTAQS